MMLVWGAFLLLFFLSSISNINIASLNVNGASVTQVTSG